jgi:hypothetical protein
MCIPDNNDNPRRASKLADSLAELESTRDEVSSYLLHGLLLFLLQSCPSVLSCHANI